MKALKDISIGLNIASIILSVFTIGYILYHRINERGSLYENEDSVSKECMPPGSSIPAASVPCIQHSPI